MSSEMIAYPNTKLMCSINIDGAAAAIVTNEAYARKHGLMGRAVRVRGEASLGGVHTDIEDGLTDFNEVPRATALQAYARAGLDIDDLDHIQLHYCHPQAALLIYENTGLCQRGRGGALSTMRTPH